MARCLKCGKLKNVAKPKLPKWVRPDGTMDWDTYWASMPDGIRNALGLTPEDLTSRGRKVEGAPPPPDVAARIRAANGITEDKDEVRVNANGVPLPPSLATLLQRRR